MLQQSTETAKTNETEAQTAESSLTRWRETQKESLPKEQVEEWLSVAREESKKFRNQKASSRIMLTIGFSVLLLDITILLIRGLVFHKWDFDFLPQLGLIGCFTSFAVFSPRQKEAANNLSECDDVRAVGPLVEAFDSRDKDMLIVSEAALLRLLPQMQYSDRELLTTEQRTILNRCLTRSATIKDTALAKAILKATSAKLP